MIALSLIWYFYVYPKMKKEYERNGWTWKRIYDIEVNNRKSYRELAGIIWTVIRGNRIYKEIYVVRLEKEKWID